MFGSHFTSEERQAFIRTVQILLDAGSETTEPEKHKLYSPMDTLILIVLRISDRLLYPPDIFHGNIYILITELIELLFKHGTQRSHSSLKQYSSVVFVLLAAERLVKTGDTTEDLLANPNPLHDIMDSLGEIYRLFVLAELGAGLTNDYKNSYFDGVEFRNAFLTISRYSSQSGHSKKLIQLLLSTLSTFALNRLRCVYLRCLDNLSTMDMSRQTVEVLYRDVNNALDWVRGVVTPFSLQRLSRDVISRAMLHRCLRAQDTASLGLPVQLEQCLILNNC